MYGFSLPPTRWVGWVGGWFRSLSSRATSAKGNRKDLAPDTYAYPCPPGRPGAVSQLFPTAYYKYRCSKVYKV
jgi:hypothetical protein